MHSCDRHDLRSIGWWAGKSSAHPAAASHAVEGEVVDPGTSARSRHNVLVCRSGAPAAEQPRINGMALVASGKSSLAYPRGPCLQYCLSICGNTWTDALHAAHF